MPEQNKYHFLDDRPTSDDQVGTHSKLAETLLEIIHSNLKRPFVVGLFGLWGVGKSSIVKMLQETVEKTKDGTKVVIVDAWGSTADGFLRQFVKKLARDLLDEKSSDDVKRKTDFKNIESTNSWKPDKKATKWFVGFIVVLLILLAGLILSYVYGSKEYKDFPSDKIAIMSVTFLIAVYFQLLLPKYSVKTNRSEEDVTLHDIMHFRKITFLDILAPCKQKTVCIVIDNLDRVEVDDAFVIMRAMKTFIVDAEPNDSAGKNALEKIVFVVPCDDVAMRNRINTSTGEKGGNEFLRKFFNVGIRIPALIEQDAYRYACDLIDQINLKLAKGQKDRIAHIIICLFGKNPRQPKVFLNNFLARYMVAERLEEFGKVTPEVITGQPDLFAIYVALDTEFSDLPMPKTADEIKKLLGNSPSDGNREGQRVAFLQKIDSLIEKITPSTWAAYHYLKKANDSLLIPGFDELEDAAMRGAKSFPDKLSEVQAKHPAVLEALWNTAAGDEAQIKIMRSILEAKKKMADLDIKGRVSDEMAGLIKRRIDDMPLLPSRVSYEEVLKGRERILYEIIYKISAAAKENFKAELYAQGGPKQFQVHLVMEVLDDTNLPSSVENQLNYTLDFLAQRSDELTIPSLRAKKGASMKILEKGVGLFSNGDPKVCPSDLIDYCGRFPLAQYRGHFNQIVQILARSLGAQGKYSTKDLCDGTRRLNQLIKKDNITDTDMTLILGGLNNRYQVERDNWPSKAEIVRTLANYVEEGPPNQWRNQAEQSLLEKGSHFLRSGEETVVRTFLKDYRKLVNSHFTGVLPDVAQRSESLCHTILDFYPAATKDTVRVVCHNNCACVKSWVEKNQQIDKERVKNIQLAVLDVLPQVNYRDDLYNLLGLLDVSGLDDVKQHRDGHFTNLLASRKPLTVPGNLTFVLKRMQLAKYAPAKEQRDALDTAIDDMDQKTLTDEIRDLIKEYHQVKKKGTWA